MRFTDSRGLAAVTILFALILLTGCSSENKGKIEGTRWTSQATTVQGTPIPAGAFELIFSKDGRVTFRVQSTTFTGSYSLKAGKTVTMKMDQTMPGSNSTNIRETITIEGDHMTMVDPDGTTTHFTRAQP